MQNKTTQHKPRTLYAIKKSNKAVKNKKKLLFVKLYGPFFMDEVQLPQGYRATSRRQFTFYH